MRCRSHAFCWPTNWIWAQNTLLSLSFIAKYVVSSFKSPRFVSQLSPLPQNSFRRIGLTPFLAYSSSPSHPLTQTHHRIQLRNPVRRLRIHQPHRSKSQRNTNTRAGPYTTQSALLELERSPYIVVPRSSWDR